MRKVLLMALAMVLAAGLHAQDPDDVRAEQASADAAAGKKLFQPTCGFCHGLDGRGGASGPDLIRSSLVSHDVKGNLIGPVVRNGRPEKGMPAFPLSDAEIQHVADFLHSEANSAASVAKRIPSEYPLEKLLVGNAAQGREYFAAHCASCHSVTGDLSHIAAKYKPFDLQTRIAFPSGAKPTLKVRDASGKSFEGEEVYADEFVITLRDSNRWLHTWRRKEVAAEETDPLAGHEKLLQTYSDKNVHDLFAYLETLK